MHSAWYRVDQFKLKPYCLSDKSMEIRRDLYKNLTFAFKHREAKRMSGFCLKFNYLGDEAA